MNISQLQRFVVVAEELHFPRAASLLGISPAALHSTIDKLEAEVGHPLFASDRSRTRLTQAGTLLLADAKAEIAAAPAPERAAKGPSGGKAKASKGKARAPVVKGQPKPYKKRQGR